MTNMLFRPIIDAWREEFTFRNNNLDEHFSPNLKKIIVEKSRKY